MHRIRQAGEPLLQRQCHRSDLRLGRQEAGEHDPRSPGPSVRHIRQRAVRGVRNRWQGRQDHHMERTVHQDL